MKHRAGGRVEMAARDCDLHLREEGDGENGPTERCKGEFGEGQNVLEQLDWRRVEAKGWRKVGREVGNPSGRAGGECADISQRRDRSSVPPEMEQELCTLRRRGGSSVPPSPSPLEARPVRWLQRGGPGAEQPLCSSPIPRGEPGQRGRSGARRRRRRGGAGAGAVPVPGLCRRRGPAGCGGSGGSMRQSLTQQRPAGVALPDSVGECRSGGIRPAPGTRDWPRGRAGR